MNTLLIEVKKSSLKSEIIKSMDDYFTDGDVWRTIDHENKGDNMGGIPGVCGLRNLGNCSYINSTLQCLTKTLPLRDFFLSDRYKKEINVNNPLGRKGEIAEAFADIMKLVWSGDHRAVSPKKLKHMLGKHQTYFSGFRKVDAFELVCFFLDAIHEDLNRVLKKPVPNYPQNVLIGTRPDDELSKEFWRCYKQRNDSVIVDNFVGQLRSEITCPLCNQTKIVFDECTSISIPINVSGKRKITVTVIFKNRPKPVKYKVEVSSFGEVSEFRTSLSQICDIPTDRIVICECNILRNVVIRDVFPDSHSLAQIFSGGSGYIDFVAYELSEDSIVDHTSYNFGLTPFGSVLVIQDEDDDEKVGQLISRYPFLIYLPNDKPVTSKQIYDKMFENVKKHVSKEGREEMLKLGIDLEDPDFSKIFPTDNYKQENSDILFKIKQLNEETRETIECLYSSNQIIVHVDINNSELFGYNMLGNRGRTLNSFHLTIPKQFEKFFNFEEEGEVHESCSSSSTTKKIVTLNDCLSYFSEKKKLSKMDSVYCVRCKEHVQATKKTEIWKTPKILVLQLKRFQNVPNSEKWNKIENFVDFPEYQNMSPFIIGGTEYYYCGKRMYKCFAVLEHYGGAMRGHYTAKGSVPNNEKKRKDEHLPKTEETEDQERKTDQGPKYSWYDFNDSFIKKKVLLKESKHFEIPSSASYVLFYQEVDQGRVYDVDEMERTQYLRLNGNDIFIEKIKHQISIRFLNGLVFENCFKLLFL